MHEKILDRRLKRRPLRAAPSAPVAVTVGMMPVIMIVLGVQIVTGAVIMDAAMIVVVMMIMGAGMPVFMVVLKLMIMTVVAIMIMPVTAAVRPVVMAGMKVVEGAFDFFPADDLQTFDRRNRQPLCPPKMRIDATVRQHGKCHLHRRCLLLRSMTAQNPFGDLGCPSGPRRSPGIIT
ncbi:hypothetical protein [Hydrogenibacillus sp. N12]|uniref:hypothetical protein n=1 Tax=Hydrogenibacillus sp. N12 TaxID=2866627 RepID=UPI001C7D5482|nr:hypothetical protein [Hydrogenibacillus sp. N12]QZA33389.1 hypothetical protein K2M58_02245 [Hydrogenibacillus sp. N12]